MLGGQRLGVRFPGDQSLVVLDRRERDVGGEALLRVGEDEVGARLGPNELRKLAPVDSIEARVEPAPAGHAVDVDRDLRLGQPLQFVVAEGDRLLDLPEDPEVPGREVGARHGAGVQDGPLLRRVLPGRQTRRIESLFDELLLGLRPEQGHSNLD